MALARTTRKARLKRVLVAGTSAAVVTTALAAAPAHASSERTPTSDEVPRQMVRSMVQDTGVSRPEAMRRLSTQDNKDARADKLTKALGVRSAGAYIDRGSGDLVINVTGQAAAERVRGAGARARVVPRSMARLTEVKSALSEAAVPGTTLAIDVRSNAVEVTVPRSKNGAQAQALVEQAEGFGAAATVERVAGMPRTHALYGGEAIYSGGSRCSTAVVTTGGYVLSAGHCTTAISSWSSNDGYVGPSVTGSFPGNDYGLIRIDGSVNPVGQILYYNGTYEITNAGNPPPGTYVCKTGSTTGTTCGYILQYGSTVYYPSGTVYDLIETDVCTQPGDSGGGMFAGGNQAVGIVSGGTTVSCSNSSYRSYFENVTEALNAYGLNVA